MMMSETLLERLKRHNELMPDVSVEFYPGDVLELIGQANTGRDEARARAAELEAAIDKLHQSVRDVLSACSCAKHAKAPFSEFYEAEAKAGCAQCASERAERLAAALTQLKDYFDLGEFLFHRSGRFEFAVEIIDAALAAAPVPVAETEPGLLPEEEIVHRTGVIASVSKRPDLVIGDDAAPAPDGLRERCEKLAAKWVHSLTHAMHHESRHTLSECARELQAEIAGKDGGR